MGISCALSCLCALLVLGAARAQDPKRCASPPLMSGAFSFVSDPSVVDIASSVSTIANTPCLFLQMGPNGLFNTYGKITYDNFAQRARVQYSGFNNGSSVNVEALMLFKEKTYYEINWKKFTCKKRDLDGAFVPMQVPPEASLMGQAILGSSSSWGMGVLVNTWYGPLPGNGTYSAVFTEVGCIPLTYTGFTPKTGWTMLSTFNWVIGTVDPMQFIPPWICPRGMAVEAEAPGTFFNVLENFAETVKSEESN